MQICCNLNTSRTWAPTCVLFVLQFGIIHGNMRTCMPCNGGSHPPANKCCVSKVWVRGCRTATQEGSQPIAYECCFRTYNSRIHRRRVRFSDGQSRIQGCIVDTIHAAIAFEYTLHSNAHIHTYTLCFCNRPIARLHNTNLELDAFSHNPTC